MPDTVTWNPQHDDPLFILAMDHRESFGRTLFGVEQDDPDPAQRAAMRLWTKAVDEYLHPACAELTFASCHRYIIERLSPEKLIAFLESTPPISVTADWHARKK